MQDSGGPLKLLQDASAKYLGITEGITVIGCSMIKPGHLLP